VGLQHLHNKHTLAELAKNIIIHNKLKNNINSIVNVSSIWVDGTPQAHGIARNNKIKCELADLLYIVEEKDTHGNELSKKALLLQGKTSHKFNKIDSGNSTKKERALFEKLDRSKTLTLRSGVSDSSSIIGSYLLGGELLEGLSDCAKFLLMPKKERWKSNKYDYFPFHVTWPKHEKYTDMEFGLSLTDTTINMTKNGEHGKPILNPRHCEWSRLVTDLENNYKYIIMNGYDHQNRINNFRSSFLLYKNAPFGSRITINTNYVHQNNQPEIRNESSPYISIVKVEITYKNVD
jgi:hypothetical protein